MFRRFFRKPEPLTGAPAVRRQKTYSAQSGYVYQYRFEGRRAYMHGTDQGMEYVFGVTADRKTGTSVSVFVSAEAVLAWEHRHGRELSSSERYAVAKMSLFQAFDERQDPSLMRQDIRVRTADIEAILENLGID